MRISTSMMHRNAVNALMQRQTELSKTQNEVATGLRVQKPSDDPVAAVRILQLEQSKSANVQFGTNITAVNTRLEQEEQALADSENILQRVYELAVKANSSALGQSDRQSIATELTELNKQLVDIANRKDANDEYLFAGVSTSTQPFARNAANTVTYAGDSGTRNVQVGSAQYVQDGDHGQLVFMGAPEGNGTFALSATTTNTGTGVITGSVQNPAAWVADDYTLTFSSPTDWQITDSSAAVVASGANYTAGAAITFNGVQVSVTGAAAAGDSFTVARSGTESIFDTIDDLVASLGSEQVTNAGKAQFQNQVNAVLTQLDQTESHLLSVRTSVGVRMSMLEKTDITREDALTTIAASLSTLRESDYASAVSRLSQQYVGLQAAQQSYAKISQLSLFDYL